jgi:hypothetical protein
VRLLCDRNNEPQADIRWKVGAEAVPVVSYTTSGEAFMRNIVIAAALLLFIPLWWITVQMAWKHGYEEAQSHHARREFQQVVDRIGK